MQRLRLLGPVRVDQAGKGQNEETTKGGSGRHPRFRSWRTVALLGYLAIERRPMAREHLASLFWPDEAPGKGRSNLRRELYNLTKVLPDCWQADSQTAEFFPSAETTVDIYMLLQLEAEGRWQDAAELLGGEFLEGLNMGDILRFETWLLAERERWRARSQAVLTHACNELIEGGRHADALQYGRRILQNAPWNEEAHRKVMRLLVWTGQREAALMQFELCRKALAEELGIEPSRKTRDLHRQIQLRELEIPPTPPAFMVESMAKRDSARPTFVARDRELAWLNGYLEAALAGQGQVVFITGGPGRGKTALMDAFARQALASYPDLLIARGNCDAYSGAGDAYSPFRDVMAMLTGDVEARWSAGTISSEHAQRLWKALPLVVQALQEHGPQLFNVLVPGAPLLTRAAVAEPEGAPWLTQLQERVQRLQGETADAEQARIYEQFTNVLRSVAEKQPLLLFLDDMQWVDAASVGFLFHAGRRLADVSSRILIVCGYRPTEIVRDLRAGRHLLGKLLSEFKRTFGDVWLSLSWANETEGRRFVDNLIDSEPNRLAEGFRTALFQRTGGHPLFTVELLRAMREQGDLVGDSDGYLREGRQLDWQVLPARVEAVIEERIQRLEPELQEILTIASVEGEVFTAQVVAHVRDMGEGNLLRRLAQDLERRYRLVQEQEESQTGWGSIVHYRFGHALFQTYLYGRLGQAERRLLHRAVAASLEELFAGELDVMAVQLARHYDQAGDYANALRYFTLAADHAAGIYANDEAIGHYTRAISLTQRVLSDAVSKAGLHRGRGLAYGRAGQFDLAFADQETALRIAGAADEPQIEWRVLIDLGRLWASRDYKRARVYYEKALEVARRIDDSAVLASSLNWMGNWYANDEEPSKALVHHREAMQIFEEGKDRPNLAKTLDLIGIAYLLAGDFNASVAHYDRAIRLFRELDDLPRLASSLMGRAVTATAPVFLALMPAANTPDAFADFQGAVQIAQEIGSFPDEAWSMWPLGLLFTVRGEFGQALESSQRGLQMASDIEHREWIVGNHFARGVLFAELLAPKEARQELEKGLALAKELRSQYWINHVSGALAQAHMMLGELSEAQRCMDAVISSQTLMDTTGKRYCWARKAELALAQREVTAALDITERLIATATGMEPGRVITFLWLLKAEAFAALGRDEEAIVLLRAAAENVGRSGGRFLLWRIHGSLARLYQATDREEDAGKEMSMAQAVIEEMATTIPDKALRNNFRLRASEALYISASS